MNRLKLNFKEYCFRPQWKFILLTLLFISLFIKLGLWQLHRAKEKELLRQSFESQLKAQPLQLSQIHTDIRQYRYFAVQAKGSYDNAHSILIDNKFYQHQAGYQILTPFILKDDNRVVLINRGWIPMGNQRRVLPNILPAQGEQTLRGFIYLPEKAFVLGSLEDQTTTWPLRVQAIQLEDFARALQKPLYPFVILLADNMPNGFIRDWQTATIPAQKHVGYAVQWFSFAFVLFVIFIYLNLRRKNEH